MLVTAACAGPVVRPGLEPGRASLASTSDAHSDWILSTDANDGAIVCREQACLRASATVDDALSWLNQTGIEPEELFVASALLAAATDDEGVARADSVRGCLKLGGVVVGLVAVGAAAVVLRRHLDARRAAPVLEATLENLTNGAVSLRHFRSRLARPSSPAGVSLREMLREHGRREIDLWWAEELRLHGLSRETTEIVRERLRALVAQHEHVSEQQLRTALAGLGVDDALSRHRLREIATAEKALNRLLAAPTASDLFSDLVAYTLAAGGAVGLAAATGCAVDGSDLW